MTAFFTPLCYTLSERTDNMATLSKTAALRRPAARDIFTFAFLFLASRASVMGMHPFGAAAFAACVDPQLSYLGIAVLFLGILTSAPAALLIKYLSAALLIALILPLTKNRTQMLGSAICGAAALFGGVLYSLCFFTGYADLIMAGIEGLASGLMYIVFLRAREFAASSPTRSVIAKDELICAALAAGVCVTGLAGARLPLGISIDGIAAACVIMCASYACSASAAGSMGLGIGFMCSMSAPDAVALTGFYGLCAMLGSLLKGLGRLGVAVGFLAGGCAAFIYSQTGNPLGANAPDLVIGSLIFLLIPPRLLDKLRDFAAGPLRTDAITGGERIRAFLSENLKRTADAFTELGSSFRALSESRLKNAGTDAADIFEDTARAVCSGCQNANTCWEREFSHTYKRLMLLLDEIEQNGGIDTIPKAVSDKCIRSGALAAELTHTYNLYRRKKLFLDEAVRARNIAAEQFTGFSRTLSRLCDTAKGSLSFNSEVEELLVTELDKQGISLFEVSVIELGGGRYEIYLGLLSGAYMETLESTIEAVTGSPVEFESESGSVAKFVTKPQYTVMAGLCSVPCEGCDISGDYAEIFDTEDHRSFIIISDGMGSGADARNESRGIVRLLRSFVTAGYDAETAIRTVNSALCLFPARERAATIDMLCIDRMTGIAKLFKIGCAQSFFLHSGVTDVLFPMSIPAGMVEEIDLRPQTLRLHEGDVIVMVTDGITQSGSGEWLRGEIDADTDAQKTAQRITDKALERSRGTAFDDMTCAVVRIRR